MPILELRIRKAVRRNGAKLLVATERPTALDGGAAIGSAGCIEAQRYSPGEALDFIEGLRAAIASGDPDSDAAGFADALRDDGPVVIVWGEGILAGGDREQVAEALLGLADVLGLDGREGAGLYEIPAATNGRGLREVGCAEESGPGYAATEPGRSADEIRAALEAGELDAVILADVDPVRDFDDPEGWKRALSAAKFTLDISMLPGDSGRAANVHLPAESHAEKEGTLTHPDGRLQRVRPSVPRPGAVRPVWQALSELSGRLGADPGAGTAGEVFDLIAAEVPFYAGITVDDIGGMGLRWQDRHGLAPAGRARCRRAAPACDPGDRREAAARDLRRPLGRPRGRGQPGAAIPGGRADARARPDDAERLGLEHGQRVEVSADGRSLTATVGLRERMLAGAAFLTRGTATDRGAPPAAPTSPRAGAEPEPEPAEPPDGDADGAERPEPSAPSLVVTKREPVSW